VSGELVGEVLDAAESGRLDGLSRPAFAALLAIAERCHHISRQGTVRIDPMRAAIYTGNSRRTARRAIRELKDAGLIRVVKRGYKAPNGEAKSSMYEMAELVPPKVAEPSDELVPSKVAETPNQASAKSDQACAKSAQASAAQGGT
jgi:DNA-binding transcriptional ArsR family regulator